MSELNPNEPPDADHVPAPRPPPTTQPTTPRRVLVGQFLAFMGPMVTIGGLLAVLRLHDVQRTQLIDPQSLFFASLAPIGFAMWIVSLWLRRV